MKFIACKDCAHFIASSFTTDPQHPGFCFSPQLQPHIDGDQIYTTYAGAVRDLAALCGQEARWFRKAIQEGGMNPRDQLNGHRAICAGDHSIPAEECGCINEIYAARPTHPCSAQQDRSEHSALCCTTGNCKRGRTRSFLSGLFLRFLGLVQKRVIARSTDKRS